MTDTVIKRCGCGAMYTRKQWAALERPTLTVMEDPESGEVLQYRHCSCGSTICVELVPAPDAPEPAYGDHVAGCLCDHCDEEHEAVRRQAVRARRSATEEDAQ